jgi:hypothetical protein
MNTSNTPREHVQRVLGAYDRQRRLGLAAREAVSVAALHLGVQRETVVKALAIRDARRPALRAAA